MNVIEAILKRRSIRKFSKEKVSDEIINKLLEAAMAAPSACNKTPWEFYVVKSDEMNRKLEDPQYFRTYESPLKIVVCGNKNDFMANDREEFWVQDCSSAIENILVSALEYGLGNCWCGVYPVNDRTKACKSVIGLDDNIIPLGIILVGYPLEDKESRTQYEKNRIHII